MLELISKFKKNKKYNMGIGYVINKGSKIKACKDCGASIINKDSPKVAFICDCNHERKKYLYTGERYCGVIVACPECKTEIKLCC